MSPSSLFLIAVLLGVLGWCIHWHIQENKAITAYWKESLPPKDMDRFVRLIWSRSIQLFAVLTVLLFVVLFYSMQLDNKKEEITALQQKPVPYYPPVTAKQAPPLIKETPVTIAETTPKIVAAPVRQASPPPAIIDVFKPSSSTIDQAAVIDNLKQQYEDTIILYFIMNRCKHTLLGDYELIMSSLQQDIKNKNAPVDLSKHIVAAAQGSYKELYTKNSCRAKSMAVLAKQYRNYIRSLPTAQ